MKKWIARHERLVPLLAGAGLLAGLATAGTLVASDHQDTPDVELNPRYDVNDVYAFPSSEAGRIALVLGTSSPITPAATPSARFGTKDKELYQLKIDTNGDAVEDLVFQITFTGKDHQRVSLKGPLKPKTTGATGNVLLGGKATLEGEVGHVLGDAHGIQLFAGPRDDPFFIDLEQFFRILPDRRPVSGPLSVLPEPAGSFRDPAHAVDFVRGFNDLAIVIELPVGMLSADGVHPGRFGVWGTTSRARS
jgi:hypothetical protein